MINNNKTAGLVFVLNCSVSWDKFTAICELLYYLSDRNVNLNRFCIYALTHTFVYCFAIDVHQLFMFC